MLALNWFHRLFWCFPRLLWTSNCRLGKWAIVAWWSYSSQKEISWNIFFWVINENSGLQPIKFWANLFFRRNSFSAYGSFFPKNNISYPLISTRTFAYQVVGNVSFSENFPHLLNEWFLRRNNLNYQIDRCHDNIFLFGGVFLSIVPFI